MSETLLSPGIHYPMSDAPAGSSTFGRFLWSPSLMREGPYSKGEPETDEMRALKALADDIEALCDGKPMYSYSAYTHNMTPHIVFGTKGVQSEGDAQAYEHVTLEEAAKAVLSQVEAYAYRIAMSPENRRLTWRRGPEFERTPEGARLTVRLSIEPRLVCVAKGVWVEASIALGWGA